MSQRILMTPDELDEGARIVKSSLDEMTREINTIKRKIDEVIANWEGASQQAFIHQFEEQLYPILRDTVPEVLSGIAMELEVAAKEIRTTDENLAGAFRGQ